MPNLSKSDLPPPLDPPPMEEPYSNPAPEIDPSNTPVEAPQVDPPATPDDRPAALTAGHGPGSINRQEEVPHNVARHT